MPSNRDTPSIPNCIRIGEKPPYDGPYDVDRTGYMLTDDGGIAVYLGLGKHLDFYRLEVVCTVPPSWHLWHLDSAVRHVDPECIGEDLVFRSEAILSVNAKGLRVVVQTPASERSFPGVVILVETRDEDGHYELTFRLTDQVRLVFERTGWTLHDDGKITRHDALRVSFAALS